MYGSGCSLERIPAGSNDLPCTSKMGSRNDQPLGAWASSVLSRYAVLTAFGNYIAMKIAAKNSTVSATFTSSARFGGT